MSGGSQLAGIGLGSQGFQLPDEVVLVPLQRRGQCADRESQDWYATEAQIFDYLFEPESKGAVELRRTRSLSEARLVVRQLIEKEERFNRQWHQSCDEIFPIEWIRLLAYRNYEARGHQDGHHEADWFAAKVRLYELFFPLITKPEWDFSLRDRITRLSLDEALAFLEEFGEKQRKRRDLPSLAPRKEPQKVPAIKTIKGQDPELVEIAKANRHPLSFISASDRKRYHGKLVAVVVDESKDAGKVFASVDLTEPQADQRVMKIIQDSPFAKRRWALCEILPPEAVLASAARPTSR